MTESCSAIILAGGESRRMGRPKAWLDFHGRPLLAHMVDLLSSRFDEVIVIAAPGQELPETAARVVRDEELGKGPVAGLAAGLKAVTAPLAFATAVDAPLLRIPVVDLLLWELGEAEAVVAEWGGRLQPLCGVYRARRAGPVLQAQLESDALRLTDALALLDLRIVTEAELRRIDSGGLSFLVANSPDEYEQLITLSLQEQGIQD